MSARIIYKLIEKAILSLRAKNAIQVLPPGTALGFTSTFFLAPKKSAEWRPIINLRPLNYHIKPIHFRMETLSTVLQSLTVDWWAASFDLKDAYLHVPILDCCQHFLPPICLQENGVPVPLPTLRSLYGSMCLHQDHQGDTSLLGPKTGTPILVLG